MRLFVIPLACLLIATGLHTSAQTADSAKIKEVEKGLVSMIQVEGEGPWTVKEHMEHFKVKALSIAVVQNYKIAWAKAYGWADDSLKTPATTQTLFQAASISKSLNGVGVMKLVQDKKIDLYADINNYLASWKFPYDSLSKGKKISTANLLSHTAGLTVHGFEGYTPGKPVPTVVQVLDGKKARQLRSDTLDVCAGPQIGILRRRHHHFAVDRNGRDTSAL